MVVSLAADIHVRCPQRNTHLSGVIVLYCCNGSSEFEISKIKPLRNLEGHKQKKATSQKNRYNVSAIPLPLSCSYPGWWSWHDCGLSHNLLSQVRHQESGCDPVDNISVHPTGIAGVLHHMFFPPHPRNQHRLS